MQKATCSCAGAAYCSTALHAASASTPAVVPHVAAPPLDDSGADAVAEPLLVALAAAGAAAPLGVVAVAALRADDAPDAGIAMPGAMCMSWS
jgi:hypothetical protein